MAVVTGPGECGWWGDGPKHCHVQSVEIFQQLALIGRRVGRQAGVKEGASVGGVWLDKGEWELLKNENLAGSLNAVLTANWQRNIRINSTKDNFSAIYQDKFGSEPYEKVKALREWLNGQPNKADLRAYLLAEDPYSAEK